MKTIHTTIFASLFLVTSWNTRADPLDSWQRQSGLPPFVSFDKAAVGAGLQVVLGGNSLLIWQDGRRWVSKDLDSSFTGIAFGNGVFVLGGTSILMSSNALDWVETATTFGVNCITFGNGSFVVAVADGSILTSPDGKNWTSSEASTGGVGGITYGKGLFVAVGGGSILTSPDAREWTERSVAGFSGNLRSVAFGNGKFVAVGGSCVSWPCVDVVVASTDGLLWTEYTNPVGLLVSMNSVAFGNGVFALSTGSQTIYSSPDGITWTPRVYAPSWLNAMTYGDGTFLAVGGRGVMMTSPDGINWTERKIPLVTSVTWGAGGWVAVGFNGTVMTSTDGASWQLRDPGTPLHLYCVAYGNGTFAAVGQIILSSTNGSDWTVRDAGPNYDFQTVAFVNGMFMAVGASGAIKVSTNGVTWSPLSSGTTATLYGIAYGNNTFVFTGAGGTVHTSADGVNWTPRTSGTVQDINGVTYGNGVFVAQGNSGVILTSPDGATWTPRDSGTGQGLATSAYGFGRFVVVGLGGTILTSTNGTSWVSRSSGTPHLLLGIGAGLSTFVIVGESGTILQSDPLGACIIEQPQVQKGLVGSTVRFEVGAGGLEPLLYQWYKDGESLTGKTNRTLTFTNLQLHDEGDYHVRVSNAYQTVSSGLAHLTVIVPLTIVQPLLDQTVVAGGNVTFSVAVTGNPLPFGYEWRRISPLPAVTLASNTLHATVAFFTVTNVTSDGQYRLTVRNTATTGGRGSTVTLTVLADDDRDGIPDAWESAYAVSDAAADDDHDGQTNLEEYQAGTDPTNATSLLRFDDIRSGPPATLQFSASSNKTYSVLYTDTLNTNTWTKLADVFAQKTNRTETITDPNPTQHRYYRLVMPQQP